jgi:hypothetical protein
VRGSRGRLFVYNFTKCSSNKPSAAPPKSRKDLYQVDYTMKREFLSLVVSRFHDLLRVVCAHKHTRVSRTFSFLYSLIYMRALAERYRYTHTYSCIQNLHQKTTPEHQLSSHEFTCGQRADQRKKVRHSGAPSLVCINLAARIYEQIYRQVH